MSQGGGKRPRSGLALLDKRPGVTSFQALTPVKRALGAAKVGHAGTLDRFASGLLVALAGPCSRLASYVAAGRKEYRGLVAFGAETDTLDPEGEVVASARAPTRAELESALAGFRGTILQSPPAYSAVHVGGERAYRAALRGEAPEMAARPVTIHSLELESYEGGKARISVSCSSGTYVRSLARDIALACGSRAHLEELERLAVGPFRLKDAVEPGRFDPDADLRPFGPRDAAELGLCALLLADAALRERFVHGMVLEPESLVPLSGAALAEGQRGAVFDPEGDLLGIVLLEGGRIVYERVLAGAREDER